MAGGGGGGGKQGSDVAMVGCGFRIWAQAGCRACEGGICLHYFHAYKCPHGSGGLSAPIILGLMGSNHAYCIFFYFLYYIKDTINTVTILYLMVCTTIYMHSNVGSCGIHLESILIPSFHVELDGIQVESSGMVVEYPSEFHVDST
jgi:hypothetical protein